MGRIYSGYAKVCPKVIDGRNRAGGSSGFAETKTGCTGLFYTKETKETKSFLWGARRAGCFALDTGGSRVLASTM
jgi:hypothetical protein